MELARNIKIVGSQIHILNPVPTGRGFGYHPGISSFQIPENIAYCPEYCGNQAETAKKMSAILTKTKEVTLSSSFKL
jgi:hypothetical protein